MGLGAEVLFNVEDGVAIIELNRPDKLNCVNHAVLDGIEAAFDQVDNNAAIRALIFTGVDLRAFTVGIDIDVFSHGERSARDFMVRHLTTLYDRTVRLRVPVIAAIEGYAYATGSELTACCDIVYAGRSATFCYPDLNLGIIPGLAAWRAMDKLVRMRAHELMYTAEGFDAEEALSLGLITRIVEDGEALAAARATARTIAGKGPLAVETLKRALNRRYADDWLQFFDLWKPLLRSRDFAEGIRAFREKRQPAFGGQ